jgi:hypothetical protein
MKAKPSEIQIQNLGISVEAFHEKYLLLDSKTKKQILFLLDHNTEQEETKELILELLDPA